METKSKPRVTPAQYEEMMKRKSPYAPGSIADLIERFMRENATGLDATYRYRKLQKHPVIGPMLARDLAESDVIEFCQERRKEVCGATVMHDIVCLTNVLKYAGSGVWKDCLGISAARVIAAKPFLVRQGYVGKSQPRERRPLQEELAARAAYFAKQNENDRTVVDMVLLDRWQVASGRRIGESCRLLWEDWRREDQTILVRKMKDPKKKDKQKWVALTPEAQAMLVELEPLRNPNEPRIFPFNSKTASARSTLANAALGITGLRLHDSRRECASALAEQGYSSGQIRLVTGHESEAVLNRVYNRPNPAKFKDMRPAAVS